MRVGLSDVNKKPSITPGKYNAPAFGWRTSHLVLLGYRLHSIFRIHYYNRFHSDTAVSVANCLVNVLEIVKLDELVVRESTLSIELH